MLNLDDAKLEKHSVTISGHRTSISLEKGFWRHLRQYAEQESISMNELVKQIDEARTGSLSGALRSFVLKQLEDHIAKLQG
ncbi:MULTISPECIES: ribbon-helix-helix domain-containing protein [Pseudomonadota]|nr:MULTISPECIES: ribbon-helix-helix domain-containing protein [Pseudomonadota]GHG08819.1 hypothetical protein GCM10017161_42970 [Thalassotalea marina]